MGEKIPVKLEENNFVAILVTVFIIVLTLSKFQQPPYVQV